MVSKNYNLCLKVISRLKIVQAYSKEVIWKNYHKIKCISTLSVLALVLT